MAQPLYDKGQPTAAKKIGPDTYAVDSFSGAHRAYVVTLAGEHSTCDCPHFQQRLKGTGAVCKHVEACRQQARWLKLFEKAKTLSDWDLDRLIGKYARRGDCVVSGVLRCERYRRRELAQPEAASCPAAEPARLPVGTAVKLYGPATEAEADAALRRFLG